MAHFCFYCSIIDNAPLDQWKTIIIPQLQHHFAHSKNTARHQQRQFQTSQVDRVKANKIQKNQTPKNTQSQTKKMENTNEVNASKSDKVWFRDVEKSTSRNENRKFASNTE